MARAARWPHALWVAQQMQEDGISPNSITTTLLLVACRPQRWCSALLLLTSAMSLAAWNVVLGLAPTPRLAFKWLIRMTESTVRPDPVSFGAVVASASAGSFWQEAVSAMDLGRSSLGERPLPGARCAALSAFARCARWRTAREVLASTTSPGREELNAATGAVELWADALAILFSQRDCSVRPDSYGRNAASTASARAGHWRQAYALTFRVGDLDAVGIGTIFNGLAIAATAAPVPEAWARAWSLLALVGSQGILLDTLALNAGVALPRWRRAAVLLAAFPAYQLRPNSSTLATVLSSLADRALWEVALGLLAAPSASETAPINAGIAACDRGGAWQKALGLLTKRGLRRDEFGFGSPVTGLAPSPS
ncbi:EMB2654 [Symbiodinium microadriaticum]|nr:EMB2654 [Symbiodinium microadriaticum]